MPPPPSGPGPTQDLKHDSHNTRGWDPGRRCSHEGGKSFGGHHEGVTESAVAWSVSHLLGVDVAGIDFSTDMEDGNLLCPDAVPDRTVADVDVTHPLC